MQRTEHASRAPRQRPLFCPCGREFPFVAGLCRACYRSAAHSRRRFDGLREEILDRDGRACQSCGAAHRLHVHHRKPGVHERALLVTVCAACHARLHRLAALRNWIPEALVPLWAEQHPGGRMSENGAPLGPAALVRTEKDQAWTRIKSLVLDRGVGDQWNGKPG
jgi:5-methylcytosine-specific restriction endonuclease McrA